MNKLIALIALVASVLSTSNALAGGLDGTATAHPIFHGAPVQHAGSSTKCTTQYVLGGVVVTCSR